MGEIKAKKCKQCGKIFIPENYHIRMCSEECREIAHKNAVDKSYRNFLEKKRMETKKKIAVRQCAVCGKEFEPRNSRHICCDAVCQRIRNGEGIRSWYLKQKEEMMVEAKKKEEKPKPMSLAEFNAQARAMNMSYGEYDLYLRMKEQKRDAV